ncbi:hypothetical protein MTR67_051651 [Solanum verrucosum]|uniref:Tf2-1-like SH3-like domain-containing protein n=1 Tax=Solanum verrucosum TaxID=315347 RepID=A0AAF0V7P7_SOLVR|nr:hypothetical protein MTR67_051651 [Solanum verrucosum]
MKGFMRFRKKRKLSSWYNGSYRISKRVGNVAYDELELPQELAAVHPIFHISVLKKCMADLLFIIPTEDIGIKDNLFYEEIPIQILDRQVRKLRTKELAPVKRTSPELSQKIWLSPDSRTNPWSVDQTTVRGLCPWIETSLNQLLPQTTVDQHRPSFDPRSVGLTVDEGQQPVS